MVKDRVFQKIAASSQDTTTVEQTLALIQMEFVNSPGKHSIGIEWTVEWKRGEETIGAASFTWWIRLSEPLSSEQDFAPYYKVALAGMGAHNPEMISNRLRTLDGELIAGPRPRDLISRSFHDLMDDITGLLPLSKDAAAK